MWNIWKPNEKWKRKKTVEARQKIGEKEKQKEKMRAIREWHQVLCTNSRSFNDVDDEFATDIDIILFYLMNNPLQFWISIFIFRFIWFIFIIFHIQSRMHISNWIDCHNSHVWSCALDARALFMHISVRMCNQKRSQNTKI